MNTLAALYRHSLGLLTDLYQLSMAQGYWKSGLAEREAVFHLFFRKLPFNGGFALAAGLESVLDYLENFHFSREDRAYLGELTGNDGKPLFDKNFLDYLGELKLRCEVSAMPEGSLAFPHEPLLRVRGPLLQAQILETTLLTLVNFQTLIATKAARVCLAAGNAPVLEFGLRRAQGMDGGLSASRAAYLGGCAATSNVLAGRLYGIPVKGTHAHSWVMSFDSEMEAFEAYAQAMPNNCIFLVDTYDTEQGVERAVEAARALRQAGHEMVGIRLDSGDLAALSRRAREILDQGGFPQAKIVASSDLDEYLIRDLNAQGAKIDLWGVGTKLATAYDQPALGGVYKLTAIRDRQGHWQAKLKLSNDLIKVSNPGILQVRRFRHQGRYVADMLYDELARPLEWQTGVDQNAPDCPLLVPADSEGEDLLAPVMREGKRLQAPLALASMREYAQAQLAALPDACKRLDQPERYPVLLEPGLYQAKLRLMEQAKNR
jgi:nicotinate phosphoribosyltransferase